MFPSPSPNLYLLALVLNLYLLAPALNSHLPVAYNVLFLFLLSNSFVTLIVDKNEAKGNISKKQINR